MRTIEALDLKSTNTVALLYHTGYIILKDYDFESDYVTFGIPNLEVRQSLFDDLLPYFVTTLRGTADLVVQNIIQDLRAGNTDKFVKDLDIFLACIPYEMKIEDDNNLHNALYIPLTLNGVSVETQDPPSLPSVD